MSDPTIVLVDSDNTVIVEDTDIEVVELSNGDVVVTEERDTVIVAVAEQGPQGIAGTAVIYAKRTEIDGDTIYKGRAAPDSSDGSPVWQISRVIISGNSIDEKWADSGAFSNAWVDYSQLTYL